ncbi:hypothetical protein KFL_004870100 [Klebsormidium nitens]|uniref:Uncharacterized protein n=1 Tax=Klebsormidium nitens TaxID=105231 RepID=A0A1Y1IDR4_KLENI|nr:hypothetical protein KFL_004870100 [Klebsormidium nitens]|eukprot:GAQ89105.1 hypothetical protein KFL_004870100 [Klebsormidium nitens]
MTMGEHESDSSGAPSTSGGHKQTAPVDSVREAAVEAVAPKVGTKRLCYYWTQGKCDQGWNANHTDQHAHKYPELPVRPADWRRVRPQPFDKYLILDLEGRVEILEFPVVLLDPKTLKVLDRFHRFVCPVKMSDEYITQYVKGKYGLMGIHRVWFDTAIPFTQVLDEFEVWLEGHGLWRPPTNESAQQTSGAENDGSTATSDKDQGPEAANEAASTSGKLQNAAFVTCGNWDIKTKIAEQCVSSEIGIPPYFNEWINIKDIYVNHYRRNASGMRPMLRDLQLPLWGTHHVGLDDAHNIARIMQRMLVQGARFVISGQRLQNGEIKFLFRRRAK